MTGLGGALARWWGSLVTEWWLIWPHRFDTYRGSPNCGRCGVPYGVHKHLEDL